MTRRKIPNLSYNKPHNISQFRHGGRGSRGARARCEHGRRALKRRAGPRGEGLCPLWFQRRGCRILKAWRILDARRRRCYRGARRLRSPGPSKHMARKISRNRGVIVRSALRPRRMELRRRRGRMTPPASQEPRSAPPHRCGVRLTGPSAARESVSDRSGFADETAQGGSAAAQAAAKRSHGCKAWHAPANAHGFTIRHFRPS